MNYNVPSFQSFAKPQTTRLVNNPI